MAGQLSPERTGGKERQAGLGDEGEEHQRQKLRHIFARVLAEALEELFEDVHSHLVRPSTLDQASDRHVGGP